MVKMMSTSRLRHQSQPTEPKRSTMSSALRGLSRKATSNGVTRATKSRLRMHSASHGPSRLEWRGSMTQHAAKRVYLGLSFFILKGRIGERERLKLTSTTASANEVFAPVGTAKLREGGESPGASVVALVLHRLKLKLPSPELPLLRNSDSRLRMLMLLSWLSLGAVPASSKKRGE